jgi:hypothetical protein
MQHILTTPDQHWIRVFVVDFSGKTHSFNVNPAISIVDLKKLIAEMLGYEQKTISIVYCANLLNDSRTLLCYNVQKDSTMHVFQSIRAGMHHETSTGNSYHHDAFVGSLIQQACNASN